MRIPSAALLLMAASPAWAQYTRPQIHSPSPNATFMDNIVASHAEIAVSPLDMIVKGPLPPEFTGIVNGRRGRLELFLEHTPPGGSPTQIYSNESPIPVGVTTYLRRPTTLEWWLVCPNGRGENAANGVAGEDSGVVVVIDGVSGSPIRTIPVGLGPSGIAFHPSGDVAWVSCRYSKDVYVIDARTGQATQRIALDQFTPHAIEYLPAQDAVLVASHLSGNNTTARSETTSSPIPTVIKHIPSDMANASASLPDRDVVYLQVGSQNPLTTTLDDTRLATDVMTIQYNMTAEPNGSRVFVVGTEAKNHQFVGEKAFPGGSVVENRLTVLDYSGAGSPSKTTVSLDNTGFGSMATPTDFVFSVQEPNRGWLVARGSDRVVEFDLSTPMPSPIGYWQIERAPSSPELRLVGARLAKLDSSGTRLTVWCEIENSFCVIDVSTPPSGATVHTNLLTYDPLPLDVKRGWGHASDARISASGSTSCNSCHVDGGSDNLLWDLSKWHDPELTLPANLQHEQDAKGPMLTQVLIGLPETGPYHWRGEQVTLGQFNGAFKDLMEGDLLDETQLPELEAYLGSNRHAPNPYLSLNRSYANTGSPTGAGSVLAGLNAFRLVNVLANGSTVPGAGSCSSCHSLPTGTNNAIQNLAGLVGPPASAVQVAQLRGVGGRLDEPFQLGGLYGERSRNGSGLIHSGAEGSFATFLSSPAFPGLQTGNSDKDDIEAFLECFDTGLAPSTSFVEVIDPASPSVATDLTKALRFVSSQAAGGHADFTALVTVKDAAGTYHPSPMFWDVGSSGFVTAATGDPLIAEADLLGYLTDPIDPRPVTIIGHPPGSGHRWAVDADDDGLLDVDEILTHGTNLFLPDSDGDGRPDGYELVHMNDPTNGGDMTNDRAEPMIASVVPMYITTNTVKLEVHTDEPCKVRAYMMYEPSGSSGPLVELPLIGGLSPDNGGFSTQHQVVAGGMPAPLEFPLGVLPFSMGVYDFYLEATDPSGNTKTINFPVLTLPRPHAVRVQEIAGAQYIPASGGQPPQATFTVQLRSGTLGEVEIGPGQSEIPSYSLPAGTTWDVKVLVSYGVQSGGPGTQISSLVRLTTTSGSPPASTPLFISKVKATQDTAVFTVDLPLSAVPSLQGQVLMVSVDDVTPVGGAGGGEYVETQAYKRHAALLQIH